MWVWCPDFVVNRHSLSGLSPNGTSSGSWLWVAIVANKSVNGLQLDLKIWVSRVKFGILIMDPTKPGVRIWAKGGTTNVLSTPTLGTSTRSYSVRVPEIWFLPMPPEGDLSQCTDYQTLPLKHPERTAMAVCLQVYPILESYFQPKGWAELPHYVIANIPNCGRKRHKRASIGKTRLSTPCLTPTRIEVHVWLYTGWIDLHHRATLQPHLLLNVQPLYAFIWRNTWFVFSIFKTNRPFFYLKNMLVTVL